MKFKSIIFAVACLLLLSTLLIVGSERLKPKCEVGVDLTGCSCEELLQQSNKLGLMDENFMNVSLEYFIRECHLLEGE